MRARALVVFLALSLASLLAASPSYAPPASPAATPSALVGGGFRTVAGDTIDVQIGSGIEKVRYIGIDTPEVHHPRRGEEPGGRAATEMNRRLPRPGGARG